MNMIRHATGNLLLANANALVNTVNTVGVMGKGVALQFFPTKKHWRNLSKLEYVRAGLVDLVGVVRERGIRSIALRPLGCGLGGLDWAQVKQAIEAAMADLPEVEAVVFQPTDAYSPRFDESRGCE